MKRVLIASLAILTALVAGLTWAQGPVKIGVITSITGLNLIDTLSQSVYFNHVSYDLEVLDEEQKYDETVLLGSRLAQGLPLQTLSVSGRRAVAGLIADGLVQGAPAMGGRLVLTLRGRLLADTVVHRLLASPHG